MNCYRISLTWITLSLLSLTAVYAQQELLSSLNNVSAQLKTVKTAGSEWKQAMRANGLRPYLVIYEVTGTDKKGRTSARTYEFNLADIDPASIRYEARKDEMLVKMRTLKGNGFIKEREGDQQIQYVNELIFYADQVDNAKALTEALTQSVPLSKVAMESKLKIGSKYSFVTDWLTTNVVSVNSGLESYKQAIAYVGGYKNLKVKLIQQHEQKGKVDEEIYDFNLSDIDKSNIEMGISGKWAYLELSTQSKASYIRSIKNGKVQSSEKSVRFYFDEVEKAREGQMIMEKLLPLSVPLMDEMRPVYSTLPDGLKKIKLAIKNTPDLGQSIAGDCQTVLSVNDNGKINEYHFFCGDIDESSPKIKASGKSFELEMETTERQKFIEIRKNGEKSNYTSSFEIVAEDIETIRFLPIILKQIIVNCKSSSKPALPTGGLDIQLNYINTRLQTSQSSEKTTSQAFEKIDKCLVQFKRVTGDGKNAGAFRYELSLSEMDASSVEIDVTGNSVFVNAATRNMEKSIKSFKGEAPSDYLNTVKIECGNILVARQIRDALQKIIIECKK